MIFKSLRKLFNAYASPDMSKQESCPSYTQSLEDRFKKRDFITGKIYIPYLELRLPLKQNQFYKIEQVPNVAKRKNEIIMEQCNIAFKFNNQLKEDTEYFGWCGRISLQQEDQLIEGYNILIKQGLDEINRIITEAHEHGHLLWYTGNQDIFYNKYKIKPHIQKQINYNEEFAVLCGFQGLKNFGYDIFNCNLSSENSNALSIASKVKRLAMEYL
ncbi:MAG: hypothetical protein U9R34_08290 [Nanoarchaeota archaeon]|nr:hypothetical protein [Nanoarchaeota archaeon]